MHTPCAGFSRTGVRYQVSGTGYLAPGTWYPAPKPVRRRGPDTEDRVWPPKNAHTAYAFWIHTLTEPYSSEVGYGTAEAARRLAPKPPIDTTRCDKMRLLRWYAFRLIGMAILGWFGGLLAPAYAQVDEETFQQLEFNFTPPGARAAAMGGAFIGLADDATAAQTNPASLLVFLRPEVALASCSRLKTGRGPSPCFGTNPSGSKTNSPLTPERPPCPASSSSPSKGVWN